MKSKIILVVWFILVLLLCMVPLTAFGINNYLISKIPIVEIQSVLSDNEYREEKKKIFDNLVNSNNQSNNNIKSASSDNVNDYIILEEKRKASERKTEEELNEIFNIINKYDKNSMDSWLLKAHQSHSDEYNELPDLEKELIKLLLISLETINIEDTDRTILKEYLRSEEAKLKSISLPKTEEIKSLIQRIETITSI